MCVGLCVRAWAFVCVSFKVSASFQVYGRPVSVYTTASGADVRWCRVTDHHALGLHCSIGPVTESTRAIAGLTLSLSVLASYNLNMCI